MKKAVENIISLRKQQNKTLAEMAELLGIAVSNYRRIETKDTALTVERAEQIAEIFGVSVGELLGLEISTTGKVDDTANDQQKRIEALQKENEALKRENELLTKLNEQYEDDFRININYVFEAMVSLFNAFEVFRESEIVLREMPVLNRELKRIKKREGVTDEYYGQTENSEYVVKYINMPTTIDKEQDYVLIDIIDLRLLFGLFFQEKWIQYYFNKDAISYSFWREEYKYFKKSEVTEIATHLAYKEKANELNKNCFGSVYLRGQSLLEAWEYAQNNYEDYIWLAEFYVFNPTK